MKNNIDIVQYIIDAGVPLKHCGDLYKSACPFHKEKDPSFTVYPKTNSFTCFGCGKSGDIINFVKYFYNETYTQALERLNISQDEYSLEDLKNKLDTPVILSIEKQLIQLYLLANKLLYLKALSLGAIAQLIDEFYWSKNIEELKKIIKIIIDKN